MSYGIMIYIFVGWILFKIDRSVHVKYNIDKFKPKVTVIEKDLF